jgi:hypothetical protein
MLRRHLVVRSQALGGESPLPSFSLLPSIPSWSRRLYRVADCLTAARDRRGEGSNQQQHIPLGVRGRRLWQLVVGQNRQRANDTNEARTGSHSPNARDDRSLFLVAKFCSPNRSCHAMRGTRCTGSVRPNACACRSLERGADGDKPDSQR